MWGRIYPAEGFSPTGPRLPPLTPPDAGATREDAVNIFLIPDPSKLDLSCGAQTPPRAVHLEYQELPSPVAGV
jgi:hypothetical protein